MTRPLLPSETLRPLRGLSQDEAGARLRRYGPNELPSARQRGMAALLGEVLREPMLLLLLACCAIYLALGDLTEAVVMAASVLLIVGISVFQVQRTETALHALRDLSSPRALVRRDGAEVRIAGRDVVPGDLVVLAEGDRVPADGVLLWAVNLGIDESLLTGESVAAQKHGGAETDEMERPGRDGSPCIYSGTLVVAGHGVARVKSTGAATELGRIGSALRTTTNPPTKLERDTARLVRVVFAAAVATCLALAVFLGLRHGHWLEALLAGLALALGLIPEEFPVILMLFLALGARRISRRRVLTRRLPAIEALGAVTVLCVDKTGTLTENRMATRVLSVDGRWFELGATPTGELPEEFHTVLEYAVLASQQNPFDPMEQAINDAGQHLLIGTEHLHPRWRLEREYPLSRGILAVTHVWSARDHGPYVVGAKGAPEAIADLCHLPGERVRAIEEDVGRLADRGLRVLGVARATLRGELPEGQHDFEFAFLGLVGLADPVRPGVPAALEECYRAGLRAVMVTGDYARTAHAVAAEIGLEPRDRIVTGPELDQMSDTELATCCGTVNLFARVVPEQKLRLVRAFAADGATVAMTGDGVNDAPALKAAHIGIAMGGRGTDVAREAAALVLLDDDFSSIVAAVRLGRRILDNIKKAMGYVLAVHVPIAGLALLPPLLGLPLVLFPLHIVFLQMIIDPVCSIAFEAEPEEEDVMSRPPRDAREGLLRPGAILLNLVQGGLTLAVLLALLVFAVSTGRGEESTRALVFAALVLSNVGLIFAERSTRHSAIGSLRVGNRTLFWVAGGALLMLALVLLWAPAREVLMLAPLSPTDVGIVAAAALIATVFVDLAKGYTRPTAATG